MRRPPLNSPGSRSRATLAAAAFLFAAVFLLRLGVDSPSHLITLLYAVPIALVAVELGVVGGLAAAALALGMYALWDVAWSDGAGIVLDYVTRGAAFLVLGGAVGAVADRLRKVSAESTRFWDLSNELLGTAGFDGYFKRVNPAWERTLGWTAEELCSRPFVEFVHPEDRERTEAEAAGLSMGAETLHFENRYRCKDGSYRTLIWSCTGIPDEEMIYAVARDATDSTRAERELRSSEQFLDSVLENLPSMVFVKDAEELRFVRFNRAGEELLGHSREQLIGKNDHDLFPTEEADLFVQKDRDVLASGDVLDIPEESIETVANGKRILHTRKITIRDERGEPRYLLGVSEDITDRKLADQKFRGLLEAAPDAMVVVDQNGRIVLINAQTETLLGYEREELIGEPIELLVPERFRKAHPAHRASYQSGPKTRPMGAGLDLFARRKDGSDLPVEISLNPVQTEEGTLVTAAIRDMTERKRMERGAEAAREEAERANAAKSEFLSRMSHELRTPLNSVLGFAELLWMDGVVDEQRDYVGQIRKSGRHLLDLINEVLDLSRIEAGHMMISPEPVHLRAAVVEAIEMIAPEAASRGISLEPEYGAVCDSYVRADQQRLKQVLLNLLSNAVKYNRPGGSVRVRCAHHDGRDAPSVTVEDTGPGIPEDQLDRLFSPFDRLGAEGGQEEGTGLGLALSKRLVELMEGRLWAESEVGRGTTFWLELSPAEAPRIDPVRLPVGNDIAAGRSGSELTVLYIEDNVSNFELIKSALVRLGSPTLLSAMQGRLGIDLAVQHRPDVVLLDLHLPDMHGREVLARLKSDPSTRSIPVIVLSADATPRQVKRLLDAGAYEYLTKPVDIPGFLETVQRAAGGREASV